MILLLLQVFAMRCSDKVVRAAKVVSLEGLTDAQLQSVYLRFARELYILSSLKSDRVVAVHGAATSCTQLALVMEYMRRGSLRGILDSGTFPRVFLSIFLQNVFADRSAPVRAYSDVHTCHCFWKSMIAVLH
jgi:serine/threonine protein kinase